MLRRLTPFKSSSRPGRTHLDSYSEFPSIVPPEAGTNPFPSASYASMEETYSNVSTSSSEQGCSDEVLTGQSSMDPMASRRSNISGVFGGQGVEEVEDEDMVKQRENAARDRGVYNGQGFFLYSEDSGSCGTEEEVVFRNDRPEDICEEHWTEGEDWREEHIPIVQGSPLSFPEISTSAGLSTSIQPPIVLSQYVPGQPFIPDNLPFEPQITPTPYCWTPSREVALQALMDVTTILSPRRVSGKGYKPFPFPGDEVLRRRLMMIQMHLRTFTSTNQRLHRPWTAASLDTAVHFARGPWTARRIREWTRAFIEDRDNLPFNLYGTWSTSLLDEGELAQEIFAHLQSIGKYVRAQDICDYLATPDVKARYNLTHTISLTTAQRWMHLMDYRWTKRPDGQYVDGHEREDVVAYRQEKYLPTLAELSRNIRFWDDSLQEARGGPEAVWVVIWWQDESTFYMNDRRIVRWVHKSETAEPKPKTEGTSLMVADFVSADFGFLRSPDGVDSAQVFVRAGKNKDGYITCEDICDHATTAMDICSKHWPNVKHVFAYDNAPSHVKRPDGALSARRMPKGPSATYFAERNVFDSHGKRLYDEHGKLRKIRDVQFTGAIHNGVPQSLYFPDDHPTHPGQFKGMAAILIERGFDNAANLRAECKNFKCAPSLDKSRRLCCCRRILYEEPDFVGVETQLELHCKKRGFQVIFLPKFHCELNPIEQCWGAAKRRYREMPKTTKEHEFEGYVKSALNEVASDLVMIRKCVSRRFDSHCHRVPLTLLFPCSRFVARSFRFAEAYRIGADGKLAAFAAKKYKSHRALPSNMKAILDEFEETARNREERERKRRRKY